MALEEQETAAEQQKIESLREYPWEMAYRTSGLGSDGQPVDILHDFYIPALSRIISYDRVAGYFRSTSLAAASQGYSAFVRHGGRMRLVVGADLQLGDVAAILRGNQQRLSEQLMSELSQEDSWPEEVKNGVALLGELVARGILEVRVALRVNAHSQEPLPVDSTEDGYVHEKWFIMTDAEGNRMSGDGSLNESRTALQLNAENVSLNFEWDGGNDARRVVQAARQFEMLWQNQNPSMRILSLPEAVCQRLIKLKDMRGEPTEIDGTVLAGDGAEGILPVREQPEEPVTEPEMSSDDLLRLAVLAEAPRMPGGAYIGMYSAPVEPWPHQEIVARRLVESYPYSYMMCDEVGLGKTIEAALAIRSLVLSGRARRVLIVPPAGLASQWHRELAAKAMLGFARSTSRPGYGSSGAHVEWLYPAQRESVEENIFAPDLNIVSQGLVSRQERQQQMQQQEGFDIVLVDESHYARRSNPRANSTGAPKYGKLYQGIDKVLRGRSRSLWLATATPMQIDAIEAYDLLRLTGRTGAYGEDPSLCLGYFQLIGGILAGEKLGAQQWRLLGQSYQLLKAEDNYLYQRLQDTVVSGRNRTALENLPGSTSEPKKQDVKDLVQPLFAVSPLSRVMLRHTRALLEIYREKGKLKSNLARRIVEPICPISFTPEEKEFYDSLGNFCQELKSQIERYNEQNKQVMTFLLNFLQLRFASSMDAIALSLERRLAKVQNTLLVHSTGVSTQQEWEALVEEDDEYDEGDYENNIDFDAVLKQRSRQDLQWEEQQLQQMLRKLRRISGTPSKIQRLLEEIQRRKSGKRVRQMVVFTRFKDSLDSILKHLRYREATLRVGVYAGQETKYYDAQQGRDSLASREEIKELFLAGEIDILLCTDAAAEGLNLQTADLLVNFDLGWNPMKIEQRIGRIDRIGQKHQQIHVLNMCYLGSTEEIVYGRLCSRLRQADLVVGNQQIAMLPVKPEDFRALQDGTLTPQELEKRAIEELKAQKQRIRSMEMSPKDIYNMYTKMSQKHRRQPLPAQVEDIWDALVHCDYLRGLGAVFQEDSMSLPKEELVLTSNRNKVNDQVQYLTWGNGLVDRLLNMAREKAQQCSWLQLVAVEKYGVTMTGYAVATAEGTRLISAYRQLKDIEPDTGGTISQEEISLCQKELVKLCKAEFKGIYQCGGAQEANRRDAGYHQKLLRQVTLAILAKYQQAGLENYNDAMGSLLDEGLRSITVDLPADEFEQVPPTNLLFCLSKKTSPIRFKVEGIFIQLVAELLQRIADGMKERKADITITMLMKRL